MKTVLQRCLSARVEVEGAVVGQIGRGFVAFVGVTREDTPANAAKMAQKIAGVRVFSDEDDKFNLALKDVGGRVLLISNFTLCGDARKGNRPSFMAAALPDAASQLFDSLATLLRAYGVEVETGVFGADMRVHVENDGPVTLILDF
ncbi:D-tyrosyl-tRNA(Tyr) deacylase [Abditibacterium utsteinense]|uniref:D-aminoacyl-tRNA deacylase n=1 Tax=Abditibacterium utsteinense TaxID=1960156 RepID=A0A2S8SQG9_9BACT|nr:D-aminoacyl-tRNA deacylase [Abditibacterium utsteinense]PQV63054.1 D-tyrosyl-tRNA(Tyr) deacylase [Abditibacterium utsteinense]